MARLYASLCILSIGKTSPHTSDLVAHYLRRLKPFGPSVVAAMPHASMQDEIAIKADETRRIMAKISADDTVIVCDVSGVQQTSSEFAEKFEKWRTLPGRIVVVIGGAYGVHDVVRKRADFVWSFGKLTLPHELAKVVALEQLYRSCMIIENRGYHHTN